METLRQFFTENKIALATGFTALILIFQILNLHTYVVRNLDHQAIVAANDDDASWNVSKAVKTRWWKDNGWVLYGPFYFRLAHSLQYFWQQTAAPDGELARENWERTAHHAILAISLMSLVALALLLSCLSVEPWWARFLLSVGWLSAFSSSRTAVEFVLRAHPDHLFTLVAALALFATYRWLLAPKSRLWFVGSACLWGLSLSVKMTLTLYALGFLFLFLPPLQKARFVQGLLQGVRYLGWMLLAYFIIGFPQTITVLRPFKAMATINAMSLPVTTDSILNWFRIFGQQWQGPLLMLVLTYLLFGFRSHRSNRDVFLRLSAFVLLPFFILLSKNMTVPSAHYGIPVISLQCVFLVLHLGALPLFLKKAKAWWSRPWLRAGIFFSCVVLLWGITPNAFQLELEKWQKCRGPSREAYGKLLELYNLGHNIWVDPYAPYITQAPKERLDVSWAKSWRGFNEGGWTVLMMNQNERAKYTTGDEPSDYTKSENAHWREAKEFFSAFKDTTQAKIPDGGSLKQIYKNECGQEIWLRKESDGSRVPAL